MDYAAGFSWELDGNEALGDATAGSASDSSNGRNENTYIDLYLNKDTYISISSDHISNSDVTMTNLVGWGYLGAQGVNNSTSLYPTSFNDSGYGIGIVSNLGPATLQLDFSLTQVKRADQLIQDITQKVEKTVLQIVKLKQHFVET